jgi:hypothetical protein
MVGIGSLCSSIFSSVSNGLQSKPEKPEAESLPSITINDPNKEIQFTNWHVEGFNLVGTAVLSGPSKLDSLEYTSYCDGVVKNRGNVSVPGDTIVRDQATEVTIMLWDEPSKFKVVIDVNY